MLCVFPLPLPCPSNPSNTSASLLVTWVKCSWGTGREEEQPSGHPGAPMSTLPFALSPPGSPQALPLPSPPLSYPALQHPRQAEGPPGPTLHTAQLCTHSPPNPSSQHHQPPATQPTHVHCSKRSGGPAPLLPMSKPFLLQGDGARWELPVPARLAHHGSSQAAPPRREGSLLPKWRPSHGPRPLLAALPHAPICSS